MNTLDIETYLNKSKEFEPYCISFYVDNKLKSIYYEENKNLIIESLNHIMLMAKKDVEIYIHNLNFDGLIIIDGLTKHNIKFSMFNNKTNIYWIKVMYSSITITFRCSYKIIGLSLSKLGEIENFPKMDFPHEFVSKEKLFYIGKMPEIDYWSNKNNWKFSDRWDLKEESIKYCERDVILLSKSLKFVVDIIEKESKSILKNSFSLASLSYKIFFKKYNYNKINDKIKVVDDIYVRNSYFGGRCEVFGNIYENEHIKYFDFSGMYAQCMKEKFHIGVSRFENLDKISKPGFYCIDYESNMDIPILPSKINNKLMFVNGVNTGTFWFEEILYFLEKGGKLLKINSCLTYEKMDYVFDKFVDTYVKLRKNGGYYDKLCKNILNSFYGSTALNNINTTTYITNSDEESDSIFKNLNVLYFYKINKTKIFVIDKDYKFKEIYGNSVDFSKRNVSIASSIASKARIKLHKLILDVIDDGGRPLYCDTDSIFAAYNKIDRRNEIKNIKWIDFIKDGIFCAPKSYATVNYDDIHNIKLKGITNKDVALEDLKTKFYESDNLTFYSQKFESKKNFKIELKKIKKNISFEKYDKRIFTKDKRKSCAVNIESLL